MTNPHRAPRPDNRRQDLLDAAAGLFAAQGFKGTSMRDIARQVGMLPGSMYYHFSSKEALLLAVYREGVRRITDQVIAALDPRGAPWDRLEAACRAHLSTLFERSDYAQVVIRIQPRDTGAAAAELVAERDRYEDLFRDLIGELGLPPDTSENHFRLMLLGAMNWALVWYHPGQDSPEAVARGFVNLLREQQSRSTRQ
jgi:AcrR family transcriptional regulator